MIRHAVRTGRSAPWPVRIVVLVFSALLTVPAVPAQPERSEAVAFAEPAASTGVMFEVVPTQPTASPSQPSGGPGQPTPQPTASPPAGGELPQTGPDTIGLFLALGGSVLLLGGYLLMRNRRPD
ncbi:LPXTG cell wall anchor domain-containing protein [Micromonospora rifamycinica]|uniref:LPXTG cell wall anchor domain-containing protein n=1 Tax=Micromonospora rifamycinica TaxID=291594 RepID=UPI0033D1EB63